MYSGVPNTTAVSQETDISFGYFKSLFQENLRQMTKDALEQGGQVSLNIAAIKDLVCGIQGDRTSQYKASYPLAFCPERNRAAWAAVDAAPRIRKCLESDKI